jgi:hypothetical protein
MQLLGEEVNTKVSVLPSGSGGCDSDDLTWSTLEDQEITDTDMVARDSDGVWCKGWLGFVGASWRWTIFIVVTHLGGRSFVAGSVEILFSYVNSLVSWGSEARCVNSGTADTNFFAIGWQTAWRVDSGATDSGFFTVGWLEAWSVNSGVVNANLFTIVVWLETRRVDGVAGDVRVLADGEWLETASWVYSGLNAGFLTVAWLETGAVLTFGEVKLSLVVVTVVMGKLDSNVWVVAATFVGGTFVRGNLDVNVCLGVLALMLRSAFLVDVDLLAAARAVVTTILFSYVDFFLDVLVSLFAALARIAVGSWDSRGLRGCLLELAFPSGALVLR